MSWGQNNFGVGRTALAVLLAASTGSAAANVLVVRASGPSAGSYPPGRSLPDDARIALRGGDTLVVLDARGTRTFRGPGNFSPAIAARAGDQTAQNSTGRRARIGAVRSAGLVSSSPTTIWHLDVSQSGNMCVTDPRDVTLWRADSSQAATLDISGPDGASRQVQWPAGSATLTWPSDLPIADNVQYQLRQRGVAVPTRVRFRTLQSQPADLSAVAEALIGHQCQEQLDLLIETAPTL